MIYIFKYFCFYSFQPNFQFTPKNISAPKKNRSATVVDPTISASYLEGKP